MVSSLQRHLAAIAFFIVITLLMTWPVAATLTERVAGAGGDVWQTLWRFEQKEREVSQALTQGEITQYIRYEFLGGGEGRLVNLSTWPWLWLHSLVGQPLTYNLIWLLSFVLSGISMYFLCRHLIPTSPWAPLLAGLLYMFMPYHSAHSMGHFGAMQLQWLPLSMLFMLRLLATPRWREAIFLGIFVTLQAWSEHHYLLWLLIWTFVWMIWFRRDIKRAVQEHRRLKWLALFLITFWIITIVVPYLPTIRFAQGENAVLDLGFEQRLRFSADLFSFFVPAPFHPIWGGLSELLFTQHFTGNSTEATHYLGLLPMLLILFFHGRIPRQQKYFWVTVAGLFGVISLGPRLHVVGHILPLPLPWAFFDEWPILNSVRTVGRASALVTIAVAILFAFVAGTQFKRRGVVIIVSLLLLVEFLFLPIPTESTTLSPVYERVRSFPGKQLIEIPAATNYTAASRALYASHIHGKEIVGNIALERAFGDMPLKEIRSLPALRQLVYLGLDDDALPRTDFFNQDLAETFPDVVRHLDIGGIVIHTDSLSSRQTQAVRTFLEDDLNLKPEVFDEVLLYETGTLSGGDGLFMSRSSDWQVARSERGIEAALSGRAALTLYAEGQPREAQLSFVFGKDARGTLRLLPSYGSPQTIHPTPDQDLTITYTVEPDKPLEVIFEPEGTELLVIENPVMHGL